MTIQDGIRHGSFYDGHNRKIVNGDVDTAMKEADHVLEGTLYMAGQERCYLVINALLVVPNKPEEEELGITCSTQVPSEVQQIVLEVLDIPSSRVSCRLMRMGGSFGEETPVGMLSLCRLK